MSCNIVSLLAVTLVAALALFHRAPYEHLINEERIGTFI